MNAKNFRVVTLSILTPEFQADGVENDLLQMCGGLGIYTFGTATRNPTRAEWREARSQVPVEILEQK